MMFAGFNFAKVISNAAANLVQIDSQAKWIWDYYTSETVIFSTVLSGDSDNNSCI